MPSDRAGEGRHARERDHRDDRDRQRSRHARERSRSRDRDRERARIPARDERPRDRDRDRDRDRAADKHRAWDKDREKERERGRDHADRDRHDRKRDRDRDSRRHRDEPDHKVARHRSPEAAWDNRKPEAADYYGEDDRRDHVSGMNGAEDMDEDGAVPAAAPNQPQEANFDADITPEEMQMMASMGIPFGFDTSQGKEAKGDKSNDGAIKVKKNRLARQYMNRRGGFNRPLPAERTGEKTQVTSTR